MWTEWIVYPMLISAVLASVLRRYRCQIQSKALAPILARLCKIGMPIGEAIEQMVCVQIGRVVAWFVDRGWLVSLDGKDEGSDPEPIEARKEEGSDPEPIEDSGSWWWWAASNPKQD